MIKNNYEVRAQKFVRSIFPFLEKYNFTDIKLACDMFNMLKNRKVKYSYGSTRKCMLSSDYVIKIDYCPDTGWGNCEDELNEWNYHYSISEFADHFAPISKYTYKGHDFYIMPRIPNVGKYCEDELYEDGEFGEYCKTEVSDIHYEQFGKKSGKFIIIDYAAGAGY